MDRTLVSAGELSPILGQTASWKGDHFVVTPLAIGQPTWPTQPSILPELVNEYPCYSGLRRQTTEGVVRGVVWPTAHVNECS